MTPNERITAMEARRRVVKAGDRVRLLMPYSEVCMHMQVAGRVMTVELIGGTYAGGQTYIVAQLRNDDESAFSAPIGTGEAGLYGSPCGEMYCYPAEG